MNDVFSLPPGIEPSDIRRDERLARRADPETSQAAAKAARKFLKDHHAAIVGALGLPGTCYDIARRTGLDHVAVARRMRELVESGQVRDTGRTAAGPNGRQCTVYDQVVTSNG